MANPFGLAEVTLAELGDSTSAINTVDTTNSDPVPTPPTPPNSPRKWVYQPITAIVTDHEDHVDLNFPNNDGGPEDAAYLEQNCAVFMSRRHGEQWEKQYGHKKHIIAKYTAGTSLTVDTTVVSGAITAVVLNAGGTGYAKGDIVTVAGGTGAQVLVTEVNAGVVTGVAAIEGGTGYTAATGAATSATVPVDVTNLYPNHDYSTFE